MAPESAAVTPDRLLSGVTPIDSWVTQIDSLPGAQLVAGDFGSDLLVMSSWLERTFSSVRGGDKVGHWSGGVMRPRAA